MKRILLSICLVAFLCSAQAQAPASYFRLTDTSFAVGLVYSAPIVYSMDGNSRLLPQYNLYLDSIAEFMLAHPAIILEIANYTDQRGSDKINIDIAQARSENVKFYLLSKGISEMALVAVGYGEMYPRWTEAEITAEPSNERREEMYVENRRTEFRILHIGRYTFSFTDSSFYEQSLFILPVQYEYDKAVIKYTSYPVLDTLVKFIITHPQIVIEISVHTVSQSSDDYGQCLSCKRAKTVCDYLISKGVPPEQVVPKGYGETVPMLTEQQIMHAPGEAGQYELRKLNRRTEIRIVKVSQ